MSEIEHRPNERRLTPSITAARAIAFGLVFGMIAAAGWHGLALLAALVVAVNVWYRLRHGEWMDYL